MLFRMGERELFTGSPLSTGELLHFICEHNRQDILVGFAFGYDVTMILRDLSEDRQRRLFAPKTFGEGKSNFTWYRDFDIDYLPKQYFRVRRVKIVRDEHGERREVVKGSTRTIYETFGFFQKSFVKIINEFKIGSEADRVRIAENKEKRSSFETIDQEVRDYCALECRYLAELMDTLRGNCTAAGIVPKTWNGAGKLAAALHTTHKTPRRKELELIVQPEVEALANMAYYGGRFEISRVGYIKQKVYEYDIRSAYPDAMRRLPCLVHGRFADASGRELSAIADSGALYLAAASFSQALKSDDHYSTFGAFGALPIRSKEGHLYWPSTGSGVYWAPELDSARANGFRIKLKHGYIYEKRCDCCMFDWVEPLYEYRKSIGSQGAGYPIKLGINSLYGKLAQRKGNGVYNNMIWAGLITAFTRAKLNDAIRANPSSIVMLATDAVYSTESLHLDVGERLGQFESSELDGLFIVQPGLYWCPAKRKRKSRGLSGKFFETTGLTERFEQTFSQWLASQAGDNVNRDFPKVQVDVNNFVGLKLALSRNKPELAGSWINDIRTIDFDYRNKRVGHIVNGDHIITGMKPGHSALVSLPHRDFLAAGGAEPWEAVRAVLEDQPDYVDLGPPFED